MFMFKVQFLRCFWSACKQNKYLQVQSVLIWHSQVTEAAVQQAGDAVYHVKEQVGPDSGPKHPTALALIATLTHALTSAASNLSCCLTLESVLTGQRWLKEISLSEKQSLKASGKNTCTLGTSERSFSSDKEIKKFKANLWQLII